MLALETKQSGGKLLHHSDLRGGGVFPGEASRSRQRGLKKRTWNVRSFYRAGSFKAAARELGSPGGGMWACGLDRAGPR